MILGFKEYWDKEKKHPTNFKEMILNSKKVHSVRHDIHKRWKIGNIIHFSSGVRTKGYECFKLGKCTATQEIRLCALPDSVIITVDGRKISMDELEVIANNDGFDCGLDFTNWFCRQANPFCGRIVHWTDLTY